MRINELEHEVTLDSIIEELNETLLNWELTEITEVTYAYQNLWNWKYWNKTVFSDFWWFDYNINYSYEEIHNWLIQKIKDKLSLIDNFIFDILKLNITAKQKILLESLEYIRKTLLILEYWLPFELEKALYPRLLIDSDINDRLNKIDNLEKELFWWKIKDNKEEVVECYNYLMKYYNQNKSSLDHEDIFAYEQMLDDIKKRYGITNANIKNIGSIYTEEEQRELDKILNKEITRDKYRDIFEIVFEIYWLTKKVIFDERSSIYDWENWLYIPTDSSYDTLTTKRVLELIQHEIESHYLNLENNRKILWNFRWAWNLEKEEWLAMVSEAILKWQRLEDIEIVHTFPKILIWELYEWNALRRFLDIDNKISPDKWYNWRYLRLKRNYPLDYPWVQHKDSTYTRWIKKIIEYIKSWNDINDLYLWKVSFSNIWDIKSIIEESNLEWQSIKNPLLIGEVILFMLKKDSKITRDNFINYISQKYNFINLWKNNIHNASYSVKKNVYKIIQIINS